MLPFSHYHRISSMDKKVLTRVLAHKDVAQMRELRLLFFDDGQDRVQAICKVRALSTRGPLPHAVECTASLIGIQLTDPAYESMQEKNPDAHRLQLEYSMAIIRMVNGLLDPFQQGTYAAPLTLLAKNIGLPAYFVDIRHMGTHEVLPSLELLRIACERALVWLCDYYWNKIPSVNTVWTSTEKLVKPNKNKVEQTLKRQNERKLQRLLQNQENVGFFVELAGTNKNYQSLLEKTEVRTKLRVLERFLESECNEVQLDWVGFLMGEIVHLPFVDGKTIVENESEGVEFLIKLVSKSEKAVKVLGMLEEVVSKTEVETVLKKKKQIQMEKYSLAPSLDDILGDQPKRKKAKVEKEKGLFEQYEQWTPTPFGIAK